MRLGLLPGLLLFAAAALGAEPSIYHEGWNDLNKNGKKDLYEDPAQPIENRVADLLGHMTLDEKIGQLTQVDMPPDSATLYARRLRNGGIGSFLGSSLTIESPVLRNKCQHILVEQSRLGIPLLVGYDSIHGFRTIFPIPLAQACAWEPELVERAQSISARESAAAGVDWTFAPMVDLARDPRWGRIAEGYGEDPLLGELNGAASVRGFQGTNAAAPGKVLACMKHYAGYGAAEGGRDYNTTEISEFTLRNFYLPQFKAGVDAGVWTFMSAFNLLSGMPATANSHTLTEILHHQWHFRGFVVSDWGAVAQLIPHGVAAHNAAAARLALTSGVDMEMVTGTYFDTLKDQVKEGTVSENVIDESVRRILAAKFAKGLFEHPYVDEVLCRTAFLHPDALALAHEAAVKSCVLLKNDSGALPISNHAKNIALIGPLADDGEELFGCWYARAHTSDSISLADAIRAKLGPDAKLTVERGCPLIEDGKSRQHVGNYKVIKERPSKGNQEIDRAVDAAKNADAVVLALGEPRDWSGEDTARSHLDLTGRQVELFDAVAAVGKPMIVVLFNGRPLVLSHLEEKAAALLEAWHPGLQGANAVADILFGDASPSGRLTTSFPRSLGQLPVYYNHYNTGRPELGKYLDGPRTPLFPFGYGLTYTTFKYSKVRLQHRTVKLDGTLTATVSLKNAGGRPGTEVVQLYLRALASSAGPRPVRELKGFKKVNLNPGESQDVSLSLSARDLGYYDPQGQWLVEPGKFQVWLAPDSASGDPADFELEK